MKISNYDTTRIAVCGVFAFLIALACLSTSTASSRRWSIKAGLRDGLVGRLKADERAKPERILGGIAESIGVEGGIVLNDDP